MFLNLFTNIQSRVLHAETQRTNQEEGAVAVEYALLLVGIAIVVGVAAAALGTRIVTRFTSIL